jgi:hypothetical protein
LITSPGRYSGIPIEVYHGAEEICPGPSISSSGLKLVEKCPIKYWLQSPLNPAREPRKETRALKFGKAAHDVLGLGENWPDCYFVTPEGYNRAATVKQKEAIAEEQAAIESGMTVLSFADHQTVLAMADRLRKNEMADALFNGGEAEVTIAWQDKETEVWIRVRPDWLPNVGRYIPDYKTCEDASPVAFARAVDNYGYYQSAALYIEGLEQALDMRPKAFMFVAQEKPAPHIVQVYQLDEAARSWGAALNRRAIRKFADCLSSDRWPGYGRDIEMVELPSYRTADLDKQAAAGLLEYGL